MSLALASNHGSGGTTAPATTDDLQLFTTEAGAQKHCPSDTVAWLNTNSGIYHEKGTAGTAMRSRARTSVARKPISLAIEIRETDINAVYG